MSDLKERAVMFDGPRDEAVKRLAELSAKETTE